MVTGNRRSSLDALMASSVALLSPVDALTGMFCWMYVDFTPSVEVICLVFTSPMVGGIEPDPLILDVLWMM